MLLASAVTLGASPATAQAACKKAHAASDSIPKERARKAIRCLVNKKRSNLKLHRQLNDAAQSHSAYMRRKRCFAHTCPGEPSLHQRVARSGYLNGRSSYGYGEVIALNGRNARPVDIIRQWMNSSSHRSILMNRSYEHIGVGVSIRDGRAYYTAVVGRRSG